MLEHFSVSVDQSKSLLFMKSERMFFKKMARKVKLTSLLQQIICYHAADQKFLSQQHAFVYPSVKPMFIKYKKTRSLLTQ